MQYENLQEIAQWIVKYIQSRRSHNDPEEYIEASLMEVATFHMGAKLQKGRMVLLPTNRFQLMSRLSQTYLVDSISRAIDYRLQFHKFHQADLFGINNYYLDKQLLIEVT